MRAPYGMVDQPVSFGKVESNIMKSAAFCLATCLVLSAAPAETPKLPGGLPMAFVPNRGQFDPNVEYLSQGDGYSIYLTRQEAIIALRQSKEGAAAVIRMKTARGNTAAEVEGLQPLPGKSNYLSGDDPAKWRTNIPQFGKVHYKGLYPGIDLVYYGNQRHLECDFLVAPGADPSTIRLCNRNPCKETDEVRAAPYFTESLRRRLRSCAANLFVHYAGNWAVHTATHCSYDVHTM